MKTTQNKVSLRARIGVAIHRIESPLMKVLLVHFIVAAVASAYYAYTHQNAVGPAPAIYQALWTTFGAILTLFIVIKAIFQFGSRANTRDQEVDGTLLLFDSSDSSEF